MIASASSRILELSRVLSCGRVADHSKVGQTSQYKGVNQEFCAVRIGAGGTTISTSPVATS